MCVADAEIVHDISNEEPLPIRPTAQSRLAVTFTEREASPAGGMLPARESRELRPVSLKKQQHQQQQQQQQQQRGPSDDGDERGQPVIYKDKGDNFARNGDRKSAIAAYSEAILSLSDDCPSPSPAAGQALDMVVAF